MFYGTLLNSSDYKVFVLLLKRDTINKPCGHHQKPYEWLVFNQLNNLALIYAHTSKQQHYKH